MLANFGTSRERDKTPNTVGGGIFSTHEEEEWDLETRKKKEEDEQDAGEKDLLGCGCNPSNWSGERQTPGEAEGNTRFVFILGL